MAGQGHLCTLAIAGVPWGHGARFGDAETAYRSSSGYLSSSGAVSAWASAVTIASIWLGSMGPRTLAPVRFCEQFGFNPGDHSKRP